MKGGPRCLFYGTLFGEQRMVSKREQLPAPPPPDGVRSTPIYQYSMVTLAGTTREAEANFDDCSLLDTC